MSAHAVMVWAACIRHVASQVWNTLTGEELLTLEGHKNVVYAIAVRTTTRTRALWSVAAAAAGCTTNVRSLPTVPAA